MEEDRALSLVVIVLLALAWAGCAENPPFPDVYDRSLTIAAVSPSTEAPIAVNQTFEVTFNTYIDAESVNHFNTLALRSNGVTAFGPTRWSMVDRKLILETSRSMEPDLQWSMLLEAENLESVTGASYAGPTTLTWFVGDFREDRDPASDAPQWSDIAEILGPCGDCHDDPAWRLSSLTYDNLVAVASSQRGDTLLVEPYFPNRSYLMHKILWDYPLREGYGQPPAWAGYDELDKTEQRQIEAWILAGAPR